MPAVWSNHALHRDAAPAFRIESIHNSFPFCALVAALPGVAGELDSFGVSSRRFTFMVYLPSLTM